MEFSVKSKSLQGCEPGRSKNVDRCQARTPGGSSTLPRTPCRHESAVRTLYPAQVEGDISTLRIWVTFQLWVYIIIINVDDHLDRIYCLTSNLDGISCVTRARYNS